MLDITESSTFLPYATFIFYERVEEKMDTKKRTIVGSSSFFGCATKP